MGNQQRLLFAAITLLGGLLVAAGLAFDESDTRAILISVGASVLAVAAVQVLIILGGGEPSEQTLNDLATDVRDLSATIRGGLTAGPAGESLPRWAADLGIQRIHRNRSAVDGLNTWPALAEKATRIDLMGLTMYNDWLRHARLVDCLRTAAGRRESQVRVLILSRGAGPNPPPEAMQGPDYSVYVRARQEAEERDELLWNYLEGAHEQLARLRSELRTTRFEALEMRTKTYPHALIVRIDGYMMVAPYLSSGVGEQSFAMELGPGPLFDLYRDEFDEAFEIERNDAGRVAS